MKKALQISLLIGALLLLLSPRSGECVPLLHMNIEGAVENSIKTADSLADAALYGFRVILNLLGFGKKPEQIIVNNNYYPCVGNALNCPCDGAAGYCP